MHVLRVCTRPGMHVGPFFAANMQPRKLHVQLEINLILFEYLIRILIVFSLQLFSRLFTNFDQPVVYYL